MPTPPAPVPTLDQPENGNRLEETSSFGPEDPIPPRIGVLEAMRWHWALVLIPMILLVGTAIAVGLLRSPVYTATTTLSVGFGAENPSALPGSVSAAQALSESYSRAIEATPVTKQIAQRTGISATTVPDHVSATPIPGTTVVKVSGTADSSSGAIATANTAADSLSLYVGSLGGSKTGSPQVLVLFRRAEAAYQDRLAYESELADQVAAEPSESNELTLKQAQVETQVALLRKQSLASVYGTSQQAYVAPLTVLSRASAASSDRTAKLELLIFIGLVAGLAIGATLATVRANWA
jgi:capsular polysaccharide biosynthesis protein